MFIIDRYLYALRYLQIYIKIIFLTSKHTIHVPGQIHALHHREVLHENISIGLGAEVAHSIADAQLDGPFQGSGCRLGAQS